MKKTLVFLVLLVFASCSDNSSSVEVFDAARVCPESGRGTFTDSRDGQVYKYTTIGNQVWMAQNLSYSIPEAFVLDPETNEQVESVIHCYEDDCVNSGNVYGMPLIIPAQLVGTCQAKMNGEL